MAVSEDEGPDSQAQEKIHEQAGVSLTPSPTRIRATKRQALRDQERRLLDKGSHAVDRARATTAGTFWSRLNAVAFMNSSLPFAALAVLCLFPFMIIVSAESGGDVRNVLPRRPRDGCVRDRSRCVSRLLFSQQIVSSNSDYGSIGVVMVLLYYLIGLGVCIHMGAVAGRMWDERRSEPAADPGELPAAVDK